MSSLISLLINFAFIADLYFKPVGQRIYNRRTNTMKTTGYLVSSTTEFTARMQNGKYNFNRRNTCFMIDTNRNTTSVINDCYGCLLYTSDAADEEDSVNFVSRRNPKKKKI